MLLLTLLGLIFAGNLVDYLTTQYALKRGAVESNPLVKLNIPIVKIIGTLVQMIFVYFAYSNDVITGVIVAAGISGLFLAIGYHNIMTVNKH